MINPLDKAHFLSTNKIRVYIDKKSSSLEELVGNIPAVNEDIVLKKRLAKVKDKDKG